MSKLHVLAFVSIGLFLGWISVVAFLLLSRDRDEKPALTLGPTPSPMATRSPSSSVTAQPSATLQAPSTSPTQSPAAILNPPVTAGSVYATIETEPVDTDDDTADDIAIWQHPDDPAKSVVIATDKYGGYLLVYGMDGERLQQLDTDNLNNVDLRDGFKLGSGTATLVVASDRSKNTIAAFKLDQTTRQLSSVPVTAERLSLEPYGLCLYQSEKSGALYAFVTSEDEGVVQQWEIKAAGEALQLQEVRRFSLTSAVEGCVADDAAGAIYIAEEDQAIWRYGAEPTAGTDRVRVDSTGDGGNLDADIEGLAIYKSGPDTGYLLAANQGSDSFTIYDRDSNAYIGTFEILGGAIDRVSDTDGIEVSNLNLGPLFPNGAFIAQDDRNDDGNQNFKLVPWQDVANAFSPPLTITGS